MCFRKAMLLAALALALAASVAGVQAGGSGLNVAVVVNGSSTNSVQLGNYYCERRQVPAQNLLRIHWPGGNLEWSKADFETHLLAPLTATLAARDLSNQVECVVLSMDIPYRVVHAGDAGTSGKNSTTSALFYGFKPDTAPPAGLPTSCSLPAASANDYAGSEDVFRNVAPAAGRSNFLAFMITATNLADAKAVVDRGVVSDGTFPTQKVFLTKSTDKDRNVRYLAFDNAILDNLVLGRMQVVRTNTDNPQAQDLQLGSLTGAYGFGLSEYRFVPGAMADNLTSYGGYLFENTSGMTRVPEFLAAGATASYGTIVEPCNWLEKFPSPQNYLYQARGFSIAECYYQSLTNPFQGVLVGEPLAAPFAVPPNGAWLGLPPGAGLSGTTNLSLLITSADATRPVGRVDLFLDGKFLQTLTNLPPQQHNILNVTINGRSMNYTVPAGATLKSVASGLTAEINRPPNANATGVRAYAHGDRLELRSTQAGRAGGEVLVSAGSSAGSAPKLTTFLTPARTNFLDPVAHGWRAFAITGNPLLDDYLEILVAKTNGAQVSVRVTNTTGTQTLTQMTGQLLALINTEVALLDAEGLRAEDLVTAATSPLEKVEFNLRANTPGWNAAQIQADLNGSLTFTLSPSGQARLDENLADLQPRNHLYLTAGATNLPLTFALDTTMLADGFHELTAVAYEGSHVRTQKRVSQHVRVANTPLGAVCTALVGGSNTLVTSTLRFAVAANTNAVARIDLFSTGGLLASVTNQTPAVFDVPGVSLDLGLHPFHALVVRDDGKQYRTETQWIRLVGAEFAEPPFTATVTAPPPTLSWPATVGRTYRVLSATNLGDAFQIRAAFPATNSPAGWVETNSPETVRFYRVSALP